MIIDKNDPNRNFFLNKFKDIVWTGSSYHLQNVYEEAADGNLKSTLEHEAIKYKLQLHRDCLFCTHRYGADCLIRTELEQLPEHYYIPYWWNSICDAYSPVQPLNVIKSENEMIDFIEKVENFFDCPEDFESYFGFTRKYDEGTGDITESVHEYYNRGGKFKNIPDKYPCVIYFSVVEGNNKKLDWIYIGE